MNEDAQLKAIAAELVALGYAVQQDVDGATIGLQKGVLTLDLLGELEQGDASDKAPRSIVVEVANRRRRVPGRSRLSRSVLTIIEDDAAVARFETISSVLRDRPDVAFEIRFFDVSADQAAARELREPIRNKQAIEDRLRADRALLARSTGRDDLSRALLVTRLWSNWLRIVAHLHPGRDRRELKTADLRTIQKDLFDQELLDMRPEKYRPIHVSVLATFEGGHIAVESLLSLEPELGRLMDWAAKRHSIDIFQTEVGDGLLGRLQEELAGIVSVERRRSLDALLLEMALVQNTDQFPRRVAGFLLALGEGADVSRELLVELLEKAAGITDG